LKGSQTFHLQTLFLTTMEKPNYKPTYKLFIDGRYQYLTEKEFVEYEKEFMKQFEFKKIKF
tara:strand:- start:289 stop:471 length:183 start_codon:yes stop_codon:yes gene_type:complete